MPLHRMQVTPKIQIPPSDLLLQSQPLSPTKLKVTRNTNKMPTSTPKVIDIPTPPSEEVCLRWNSHHSNMQTSFPHLLQMEKYVDVTLIAEGKMLKCHRMILSSCSPYFEEILSGISPLQHPVIILNGVPFWVLKMLADFMYSGEVNIDQNKVPELLDVAEILKIKGLASKSNTAENDKLKKESDLPKKSFDRNNSKQQISNVFSPRMPVVPKVEETLFDPLQLLETKFLEIPSPKPKEYRPFSKKIIGKKLKKRKSSDDESTPSPPVFPVRRGTRSRPYVKVPKYYDYEDIVKPMGTESPQDTQPFSPVHIKSEPLDLEGNDSRNTNETPSCSDSLSEFTDINDIASKLQSLEKSIDIHPIPPLSTKASGKSIIPYKIKLKSFSSMTDKRSRKEDTLSIELSNTPEKNTFETNSLGNTTTQKLVSETVLEASASNNVKIIDIGSPNESNQKVYINDPLVANSPQGFERDKQ